MNRQAAKIAIEKNRMRLMRLVLVWLVAALCAARVHQVLPKRISLWVDLQLFKAEATTGYLLRLFGRNVTDADHQCFRDAADRHEAGLMGHENNMPLRLDDIIARLKAMRCVLRGLSFKHQHVQIGIADTLSVKSNSILIAHNFSCAQHFRIFLPP